MGRSTAPPVWSGAGRPASRRTAPSPRRPCRTGPQPRPVWRIRHRCSRRQDPDLRLRDGASLSAGRVRGYPDPRTAAGAHVACRPRGKPGRLLPSCLRRPGLPSALPRRGVRPTPWAAALAAGISLAVMTVARTPHSPACATAVVIVLNSPRPTTFVPLLLGSTALLVLAGWAASCARPGAPRYPAYWW
ncbi:HPP family protein [Streptomyces sp. NPDC046465]|uniref:HPP family protein n=1 Tax=Streptomyces sp. NPDC046465 TaxID=3155810 RepID=UPI0034014BDD